MNVPGELFDELSRAHRRRWTHGDELLALILEKLDQLLIVTVRAYSDPKKLSGPTPTPFRYPRPAAPPRRQGSTPTEIRRFFRGK